MSLFEYGGNLHIYTSENQRNIIILLSQQPCWNYVQRDIRHKCAHPADKARPTVLSNAINFVTLVYLLCTQQAAC